MQQDIQPGNVQFSPVSIMNLDARQRSAESSAIHGYRSYQSALEAIDQHIEKMWKGKTAIFGTLTMKQYRQAGPISDGDGHEFAKNLQTRYLRKLLCRRYKKVKHPQILITCERGELNGELHLHALIEIEAGPRSFAESRERLERCWKKSKVALGNSKYEVAEDPVAVAIYITKEIRKRELWDASYRHRH